MLPEFMEYTPEEEAAACEYYNKGRFPRCCGKNTPMVCFACVFLQARELRADTLKRSFYGVVTAMAVNLLLLLTGWDVPVLVRAVCSVLAGCVPFGWKVLPLIVAKTPAKDAHPVLDRFALYVELLCISLLTGWIAAPYRIYRTIRANILSYKFGRLCKSIGKPAKK